MRIQDIMTKNVLTVSPEDPIDFVVNTMLDNRIHGVPVVENGKFVGMVTETDFFGKDSKGFDLASYVKIISSNRVGSKATKEEKEKILKLITSTVADIMSIDRTTINPEDEIEKLIGIFRDTGFSRIPVVDGDNNLLGIITRSDVIRTMRI